MTRPSKLCVFVITVLVPLFAVPILTAQTTSTIEGTIADPAGSRMAGVRITLSGESTSIARQTVTDDEGRYRFPALEPASYVAKVSHPGFLPTSFRVDVPLNRTVLLDVMLELERVTEQVVVKAGDYSPDPTTSASAASITQLEIANTPLNGRNYQDLLQVVGGVAINRQTDVGSDSAVSILGERGRNTSYLIDGLSNQDVFNGGASSQFSQDAIAEFQVLTTGYKAEFGRGSGGSINVVTKSGTNHWNGTAVFFYRNSILDSSNIPGTETPYLVRSDFTTSGGGRIVDDKIFFFGSAERTTERRQLNFIFPENTPDILRQTEVGFNELTRDKVTRLFTRFDEVFGRHRLKQELSFSNNALSDFLPLSQGTSLPSTRHDSDSRRLMLGISDTVLFANPNRTYVLTLRGQYRREPTSFRASHPDAGPLTQLEIFSSATTGGFFGDLGQVTFGAPFTPTETKQDYAALGGDFTAYFDRHVVKFGGDLTATRVRGTEANLFFNLLFATTDDFNEFGPVNSGLFTFRTRGGLESNDSRIRLRNNYSGLFIQDDWKLRDTLTLNLGLRWDHDSPFSARGNFSPRIGAAWGATKKTVIRGSVGVFYDQIRLGQIRDVPAFGGANITNVQPVSYPRFFYGVPTIAPIVFGLCLSPNLTDAEIISSGATCPLGPLPLIGVDRLNRVVATGHSSVPANTVVTMQNVFALTGLTPQQFVDQASSAIQRGPGFFFWGPFGTLSHVGSTTTAFPVTLDPAFRTPHTIAFNLGFEHEILRGLWLTAEYFHKEIKDIAGVRLTNVAFDARIPGNERHFEEPSPLQEIRGFGPWYRGTYDAIGINLKLRRSRRFNLTASYTLTRATDNLRCPDLVTGLSLCVPSDSFIGVPPVVTDPVSGETNAQASFTASNGNPVPKAGVFYRGPDLDRGPSDLAPDHSLSIFGFAGLPWKFSLSGIVRLQSGFRFSRQAEIPIDVDGDLNFNPIDHSAGRNVFSAPTFINIDMRIARRWQISDRIRVTALLEFFNLLNRADPAAVETAVGRPVAFGKPLQVLPGREGQIGVRVEF